MDCLHCTLKGAPQIWFWNIFSRVSVRSFTEFREHISERFEEKLNGVQAIVKAATHKYLGTGDVLAHIDRVVGILNQGKVDENSQVDVLRDSLPEEMQRALRYENCQTVATIIRSLRYLFPRNCIPNTTSGNKSFQSDLDRNRMWNKFINSLEEKKESEEPDCFADFSEQKTLEVCAMAYRHNPRKFGNHHERDEPKEKVFVEQAKCFNCEEIGHFYRDCERPQEYFFCFVCGKRDQLATKCDSTKCENRRKKEIGLEEEEISNSESRSISTQTDDTSSSSVDHPCDIGNSSPEEVATVFFTPKGDNRPHMHVYVKGRAIVALVDTGATSTVMGQNIMTKAT